MIKKFDFQIQNAAELYLPGVDWRLLKAQLQAESALNPEAVSPAGAHGIAQFMPGTWKDMQKALNIPDHISPFDAETAIIAAAYYMQTLYDKWTAPRPDADRYCLALASYNAGFGHIIKAQRYADGVNDYHSIINELHEVTGRNSIETIQYVRRIFKTFGDYLLDGR